MSDPRFLPREMATPRDRHLFGKTEQISWIEGTSDVEATRIIAARLQHALAWRITSSLRAQGCSIKSYAVRTGIGYDRVARVLRGEALMRFEDIADAQQLLGLHVFVGTTEGPDARGA